MSIDLGQCRRYNRIANIIDKTLPITAIVNLDIVRQFPIAGITFISHSRSLVLVVGLLFDSAYAFTVGTQLLIVSK